jgi:predicted NBD/HSP70 family sugar kinase
MTGQAANAKMLKRMNERTALEAVRSGHPISRAEVARRTGMSKPTVSVALQALLDAGLVREAAEPVYPSYGAVFYEPAFEAAHVLGFDVGARFLRGALCDLGGVVHARRDVDVAGATAGEILKRMRALRDELVAAAAVSAADIDGAVVGVPGVVEHGERIALGGNIPGLDGLAVSAFARDLGLPLALENDTNLAAVGEQWLGVGKGRESFVFLSIGTGIGSGLILGDQLVRGRHGAAGELEFAGNDTVEEDPCARGLAAHAEVLAKAGGLATRLEPPYEPPAVFDAARAGDALAIAVVDEEARRIARYIGAIAAVVDVELVVLGGGIGANGDLLLTPVRAALAARLPYPPTIEVSQLGESAVLMGALSLGLQAALDNVVARRRPRAPV